MHSLSGILLLFSLHCWELTASSPILPFSWSVSVSLTQTSYLEEGTLTEGFPLSVWVCLWRIFQINSWYGRIQSSVAIGWVIMGYIRKQTGTAMGNKPISGIPSWSLFQLLPPHSYLSFFPHSPHWWTVMWTYKEKGKKKSFPLPTGLNTVFYHSNPK